jgi:P2-related tail formation protein
MSKTVHQTTLLELLPPNLRGDPDIVAASSATDGAFREMVDSITKVLTIADIDHASSDIVDALAVEMRTDFYDQTLPLENRRKLVKNAYLYKFFKGTPYIVQLIISDAFVDTMMHEWFEYDGEPYHFKIITDDDLHDKAASVIEAVNVAKNVRSWFDGIYTTNKVQFTEYQGFATRVATKYTVGRIAS